MGNEGNAGNMVILVTWVMKVILVTWVMKVILVTWVMKVILVTGGGGGVGGGA